MIHAPPTFEAVPPELELREGALHVWMADLRTVDDLVLDLLDEQERARAARFARECDGIRWARARGLLRQLLGRYLAQDPTKLRFRTGPHGKPALLATDALRFNLSHSSHLALYAVTPIGEVGVDVEVSRRPIDELALAARALGAFEAERLAQLEQPARHTEFLRAWARHEAVLKCHGTGIGGANADAQQSHRRPPPEPWIAELPIGEAAAAAVAVEREPGELRCWCAL